MSLSEDLAFALHEDWRRTRLREDGTLFYYEPRWKAIKDNEFIDKLNENELPEYIRKNENGNWEIDIANACYTQLSSDWQAEYKAAVEVVVGIIESDVNYTREEIGDIIHNAWLERNAWAKGGELDVPFAQLPKEEQDKDMVQYDTALNMKEAIEVDVYVGNLDRAAEYLRTSKENNENIKLNFNCHTLYSMFDNVDTCYVKVVGVNKAQLEEQKRKWHEEYERREAREKAEAEAKIPAWKQRGYDLIYPEKKAEWDRCVEIRASDLYHGAELDNALEIMECLAAGKSVEEAIEIANSAGHSGASWSMMMSIVTNFSKRGPEFYRANHEELTKDYEEWLQKIEKQNAEFEKNASDKNEFNKIIAACKASGISKDQTKKLLGELGFSEKVMNSEKGETNNAVKTKEDLFGDED